MAKQSNNLMDKLVALCRRRGFIFQSSEIYGGINGFWDYGPLGVELKRNVKEAWWADNVRMREDIVGLDCSIIMHPKVWEASGHLGGFSDPMVDCKETNKRYRADQMFLISVGDGDDTQHFSYIENDEDSLKAAFKRASKHARRCSATNPSDDPTTHIPFGDIAGGAGLARVVGPDTTTPGTLTEPREFNLMFQSYAGAIQDESSKVYLRPETAQGIFANFGNVIDSSRMRPPFGIAQIGKSFRNEVNPRNYTFRSREFEQMEIEFFCREEDSDKWYTYWRDRRYKWYIDHGLTSERLHLREHDAKELAHYAKGCADVEYEFPFGLSELEGIANRGNYDLTQHTNASGKDLSFFDDQTRERYIPHVIEPSGGVDRATLAFLCEAYTEDEAPDDKGNMQTRTLLKLHPRLAPYKVAIFPLMKKDGHPEAADKIFMDCKRAGLAAFYDEKGAIGRRYRRQDEIGTPFCITVDNQTVTDQTVTIRDRDTLAQERISADKVPAYITDRMRVE
jgi:glycyl-tRNA synthetase